ncbi:hypothetical protein BLNAU_11772 [Blattamonas nauphoetae]|uniref:Uncharacterized protein n=1 Tax=Blattamonas nauphoetae TaxID=2049346 RepID=A0ABQ9XP54_9EUKA|nr:hypothetical protein BLNAU_11772 [Blattamonas nauphoetae]
MVTPPHHFIEWITPAERSEDTERKILLFLQGIPSLEVAHQPESIRRITQFVKSKHETNVLTVAESSPFIPALVERLTLLVPLTQSTLNRCFFLLLLDAVVSLWPSIVSHFTDMLIESIVGSFFILRNSPNGDANAELAFFYHSHHTLLFLHRLLSTEQFPISLFNDHPHFVNILKSFIRISLPNPEIFQTVIEICRYLVPTPPLWLAIAKMMIVDPFDTTRGPESFNSYLVRHLNVSLVNVHTLLTTSLESRCDPPSQQHIHDLAHLAAQLQYVSHILELTNHLSPALSYDIHIPNLDPQTVRFRSMFSTHVNILRTIAQIHFHYAEDDDPYKQVISNCLELRQNTWHDLYQILDNCPTDTLHDAFSRADAFPVVDLVPTTVTNRDSPILDFFASSVIVVVTNVPAFKEYCMDVQIDVKLRDWMDKILPADPVISNFEYLVDLLHPTNRATPISTSESQNSLLEEQDDNSISICRDHSPHHHNRRNSSPISARSTTSDEDDRDSQEWGGELLLETPFGTQLLFQSFVESEHYHRHRRRSSAGRGTEADPSLQDDSSIRNEPPREESLPIPDDPSVEVDPSNGGIPLNRGIAAGEEQRSPECYDCHAMDEVTDALIKQYPASSYCFIVDVNCTPSNYVVRDDDVDPVDTDEISFPKCAGMVFGGVVLFIAGTALLTIFR